MSDKKIISELGGAGKLAKQLGFSQQRVHNWVKRGIPYKVKAEFPHLFLKEKIGNNSDV